MKYVSVAMITSVVIARCPYVQIFHIVQDIEVTNNVNDNLY